MTLLEKAKAKYRRLAENKTFRGVAMIGSGAAVGQIVQVAATPIVSRLYGPSAYGALAVFSSILSIASILVTFRYEVTIPLPKEDEEGRDLLVLALCLALTAAGVVGLGLTVWPHLVHQAHPNPIFKHLIWTLPVGMVSIGCYQSLAYWATRKQLYRPISATRVNQAIASVGAQVVLRNLPPPGLGLILAYIIGQGFGLRPLFMAFRRTAPRLPLPRPKRLLELARKYWNMSLYGSATGVAGALGDNLPALLLAKAYGLETAGIYLMAARVFSLPAQMVGAAIAQVFMGETSQRLRDNPRSVSTYFHSVHRNLLWVGAGILCMGAASPFILPWVLGAKWHAAGVAAAIIAPMAAADITVRPLYNITVIANRPKLQLVSGLLPLGLGLVGLGVPILAGARGTYALLSYALCKSLGSVLIYFIYRHIVKNIGAGAQDGAHLQAAVPIT